MSKLKTERTHEFMIRVVFDRAVTPAIAKKEARGSLVGFSDWTEEDCAAGTLKVTALKPLPSPAPSLRGLLDEALRVLDGYSDPTAYTDSNGDQLPPDAVLHEGLLAKDTASKIRAALAASEGSADG